MNDADGAALLPDDQQQRTGFSFQNINVSSESQAVNETYMQAPSCGPLASFKKFKPEFVPASRYVFVSSAGDQLENPIPLAWFARQKRCPVV